MFWAEARARTPSRATAAIVANWTTRPSLLAARLSARRTGPRPWRSDGFGFLLDRDRKLLSIGYASAEGKLDPNCYDLLASEARLASFLAIAKGDIPARHWFRLGRAVTPVATARR